MTTKQEPEMSEKKKALVELMRLKEIFEHSNERVAAFGPKDAAVKARDYVRELERKIDSLETVMSTINELACYGSEENTDARGDMLLKIGALARSHK